MVKSPGGVTCSGQIFMLLLNLHSLFTSVYNLLLQNVSFQAKPSPHPMRHLKKTKRLKKKKEKKQNEDLEPKGYEKQTQQKLNEKSHKKNDKVTY